MVKLSVTTIQHAISQMTLRLDTSGVGGKKISVAATAVGTKL